MVSGNYFSMLGVKPAIGPRVQLAGRRPGLPGPSRSSCSATTTGSRRFARDPGVVGKKILVNDYPMTIVGVSAAGFAGLDPAQSPQIRVPILMKPVDGARLGLGAHGRPRARAGCRCSRRLKPGYTVESAEAPLQGLFTQIRALRDDAARRRRTGRRTRASSS